MDKTDGLKITSKVQNNIKQNSKGLFGILLKFL